jgi:hypothetical protein
MDLLGLFILYIIIRLIFDDVIAILEFNQQIRLGGGLAESARANPYPLFVWGGVAVLFYVAGIVLPLAAVMIRPSSRLSTCFAFVSRYNQKQYDMWVYAVLCVRVLLMISIFNFMGIHLSFIVRNPEIFDPFILMNAILIAIIVRFTQFRIRKAEPKKKSGSIKITFVED